MTGSRVLYLDSFTRKDGDAAASDEIGYGISSSSALKRQLAADGVSIYDLAHFGITAKGKFKWIQASYKLLHDVTLSDYDAIFVFHSFHQFPSEIRRILCMRGYSNLPIIGYTHGSHFDPSDTFRFQHYPGMHAADLGNLLSMDRICVVSHYFKSILLEEVGKWSLSARAELEARIIVTGLPIDDVMIDSHRTDQKAERLRILFNHSPTLGKDPEAFFRVIRPLMLQHDLDVLITRRFKEDDPGAKELLALKLKHGDRIILGDTLPISDYYRSLWSSHIQISTARHESLGIATIEAMYAYNCSILPNRLSYPEITEGLNLYDSEEELAEMLTQYIKDDSLRTDAAERLRRTSRRYLAPAIATRIRAGIDSCIK